MMCCKSPEKPQKPEKTVFLVIFIIANNNKYLIIMLIIAPNLLPKVSLPLKSFLIKKKLFCFISNHLQYKLMQHGVVL